MFLGCSPRLGSGNPPWVVVIIIVIRMIVVMTAITIMAVTQCTVLKRIQYNAI